MAHDTGRWGWAGEFMTAIPARLLALGGLLAVALAVQSPFIAGKAVFVSADGTFHHSAVVQVAAAHAEGILYPRWLPGQNGGLGDASLMHYAPLFHTLAAVLRPVGGGTAWGGMRVVFFLATLLAGWVAFGWLREFLPARRALLAAAVVAANPLFLHMLLKAEAYPWACSLPVVIVFFRLLRRVDGTRLVLLPLAATIAVQCFLHTITAFMLLVTAPLALAVAAWLQRETVPLTVRRMGQFGLSGLLGLAMAGVYLIPALTTLRYVTPGAWEFQQVCAPAQSFALPLFSFWSYGMCWSSYQILFPGLSLLLLAAGVWAWRNPDAGQERGTLADLLGFGGVALLLSSELAWPLWTYVSTLRMVQFPFRFNFVALAALLPVGVLVMGRWRWLAGPLVAASVLLTAALAGQALRGPGAVAPVETARLQGMGNLGEYRPATAKPGYLGYLERGGFAAECAARGAECQVVRQGSQWQEFRVRAGSAGAIRLPLFCYPAWEVAGGAGGASCDTATGLYEVRAAAGDNGFTARWKKLPEEQTGEWVSGAGVAAFLLLGRAGRFGGKTT